MKKIVLLIVAGLLFQYHCSAQKKGKFLVDSLLSVLAGMKEDTTKVNMYFDLMSAYVYYKPEEGLTYQAAALDLATKTRWKIGIAKIKDRIGRLNWRKGNFSEALKYHNEALEAYQQTNYPYGRYILIEIAQDYVDDGKYAQAEPYLLKSVKLCIANNDKKNLVSAYDILRYMYGMQGNFSEQTKMGYASLKVSEEIGDKISIYQAAIQLGENLKNIGNYPDALKYYKQALQTIHGSGNNLAESYCNVGIGDVYKATGNFSEAANYYANALSFANQSKDVNLLADVHAGMGDLFALQGRYTEAIPHYAEAINGYKSVAHKANLATVYTAMGTAYTHLQKYAQATKSFNNAMALNKELGSDLSMANYYSGMALLDSATGKWKDAYLHYRKYIVINDSSFSDEALKKAVASQMKYESDKKEAALKAEQEKKNVLAQAEINRQRNILYSSFAVLAVVLIFSLVVFRQRNKIAKEKKRSDQLLKDNELLIKEIHHRVKNNLEVVSSLLALQSNQIDDENTKKAILEGQNRVQSIGIVHQKLYQGKNLGAIEMKDYFINLSDSILDSFGATKRVQVECAMNALNMDIDTAVPLGLIVNELLTNTIKYAFPDGRSGKVQIKLEQKQNGVLEMQISDNGVGKSGAIQGTGFGGQLISLLTQQLGGTMKEENNNGTHIFFEFKSVRAA
jgi:two-component sensor histidine kinase/tetratricopeptide (TPR) repeat protein